MDLSESVRRIGVEPQYLVRVAEPAHGAQVLGMVEPHAARSLRDRLDDHRR